MHLTKSEQQIMEIFWQADHAMAQTEVVKTCVDRKWKERSIFSMLNSLMEKGDDNVDDGEIKKPDGEGRSAGGWLRAQR